MKNTLESDSLSVLYIPQYHFFHSNKLAILQILLLYCTLQFHRFLSVLLPLSILHFSQMLMNMHFQNGSVHPTNFLLAAHKRSTTNQKSMHTQQTAIPIFYKSSFQITGNIIMKMPLRKIILYNY